MDAQQTSARQKPKSFWWAAGSLVLMVVGAFGPWASVADLLTINGTDGGRDGWVVVGAAGVAALVLLLYLRFRRAWLVLLALLAGVAGTATAAYDLIDIRSLASGDELFGGVVGTAWGIYAALVGSISLALASVALLVEGRRQGAMSNETPPARAAAASDEA
jgi:uncharacterized membrane protein